MTDVELDLELPEDEPAPVMPVMELLPATFAMPLLTQFVPDPQLREALNQAALDAAKVDVRGQAGLVQADTALEEVRDKVKAIKAVFDEPTRIANELHKRLTEMRADWIEAGEAAIAIVGRRIYVEQQRLKALEEAAKRKEQDEADAQARADARLRVEQAKKEEAAPEVIVQLEEEAETATAPPVYVEPVRATLQSSAVVENWTSTVHGTPREAEEQQPSVENATEAQRDQLKVLMHGILNGAPIVCITWNWKQIDKLAKAGKSSFKVAGLDTYDKGGLRAKPTRRKK